MHEGHEAVINIEKIKKTSLQQVSFWEKYKILAFPVALGIVVLVTWIMDTFGITARDWTIIPHIIGGSLIVWKTTLTVFMTRKITAGVLVVLALIGTAYVEEFFAGALVAFMMVFGEYLEDLTLEKTRNAVRELVRLVPEKARVYIRESFQEVDISEVKVDDLVQVRPGERVPIDGEIIKGQAALNEASITGESMPVDKGPGDQVYVGTLNENGVLEIKTRKIGQDTTLGKIIKVVKEAQENKGFTQKTADRFAVYFTPLIIAICLLVWFLTTDLMRVMAVLVVACPCALVLATPTAVVASVGNAARKGGLIKGGITLEKAGAITAICLDKTGTITQGKPQVVNLVSFDEYSEDEVLQKALLAEKNSQHPIARAILQHGELKGTRVEDIPEPDDFEMLFGRGVRVQLDGENIEVSNARSLEEKGIQFSLSAREFLEKEEKQGRTSLLVIADNTVIGGISVADTIRPEAKEAVNRFRKNGIKNIYMLTGDNKTTAEAIAREAGITEVRANLLPEDKLEFIRKLQKEGHIVAMVGDGVNDAPALTIADVGIAMGVIGTDVAIESADISLMSESLEMVSGLLQLSKRTLGIIKQNIWLFAVLINLVGIWASGFGFLGPVGAAVVHNVASVFVVINSSRLIGYKFAQ